MLILYRGPTGARQVELQANSDEACVLDLAFALGARAPLVIDGVLRSAEVRLTATTLGEGSEVSGGEGSVTPAPAPVAAPLPAVVLHVVAGLDAGAAVPLAAGSLVVGRTAVAADVVLDADTVSARHAEVRVTEGGVLEVRDLGSRNGTWVGGEQVRSWSTVRAGQRARFGSVSTRLGPRVEDDRHPGVATPRRPTSLVHHRPPRMAFPLPAGPVALPRPPASGPARPTLALASALLPAVAGLVIVAVTGNWLFALLPLTSPFVALGTWWHGRRHVNRASRRERARFAADVVTLRTSLAESNAAEAVRRRTGSPDLAETLRRALLPSGRIWERRPGDPDFLQLVAGEGPVRWSVPVSGASERTAEVEVAVDEASVLQDVPVDVDLAEGGVIGIVGAPAACRAVARSLVLQAAVHHGPADLEILVVAGAEEGEPWGWARWLPHGADPYSGARRVFDQPGSAAGPLGDLLDAPSPDTSDGPGPVRLLVVDDEAELATRRSPVRSLLRGDAGPVAGIVLATRRDRLPASCTTVIELEGAAGAAEVHDLRRGRRQPGALVAGLSESRAAAAARALARFEDPDAARARSRLVGGLLDLLGPSAGDAGSVAAAWAASWEDDGLQVPLGVDAEGPVPVDLVADGPHALVAGTTGSGKSELLRSWVAALAAHVDPRLLSIVLVDYKGGAAFDACAELPHVAAVVTDLDAALGARALRGLEAELRRRERCLRTAGVTDLSMHRRLARRAPGTVEPLARLLVVVDEFASLAAEVPEFLDALVGVAQRGRSLGVHLVLATQRPAGVVNDAIRANTNLRVALRVQDAHDGLDVVGSALPARLPRNRPGAAVLRLGPNELISMQAAHASAPAVLGERAPIEVMVPQGPEGAPGALGKVPSEPGDTAAPSQLDVVVAACREAAAGLGLARPAPPWPEPLPGTLHQADLRRLGGAGADAAASTVATGGERTFAPLWLADDPDRQARHVGGWRPADGNLLVHGTRGSGKTTALVAAVVALADGLSPRQLHVYAVDGAAGGLDVLQGLAHTGAVIRLGDTERLGRLFDRLSGEIDTRRASPAGSAGTSRPLVVLVVDGLASLTAQLDQPGTLAQAELFQRWYLDGPPLGLATLAAVDRPGAVRHQLAASTAQRLVLTLADPLDARALGVDPPVGPPGRGVEVSSGLAVQVALPDPGAATCVVPQYGPGASGVAVGAAGAEMPGGPCPVGRLPVRVARRELGAGSAGERPWRLPIGVAARSLGPAVLVLHDGDHLLVAGPARSGRTTALLSLAESLVTSCPSVELLAVLPRLSSRSRDLPGRAVSVAELDQVWRSRAPHRPLVVLVDDAELVEDPEGTLERLVGCRDDDVTVIAAGRSDALRTTYAPWLRLLRQSRTGLLLQPDGDLDGDLLSVRLPRHQAAPPSVGRGYLVQAGTAELVQVALP